MRDRVEELQAALLEAEAHIEDGRASAALEAELGVELEAVRAEAAGAQVCWSCVHEALALAQKALYGYCLHTIYTDLHVMLSLAIAVIVRTEGGMNLGASADSSADLL